MGFGGLRNLRTPRTLARTETAEAAAAPATESNVGLLDRQHRRRVAIVVTSDGRRINVPVNETGIVDVVLLPLLRSLLLGLDGLLELITGSRQENGGTRR